MDKVGKNTGPGKVFEFLERGPKVLLQADLYNYNTDGNLLKDEHKAWIDLKLVPLLRNYQCHVKLCGTASQVGDAKYNQLLSLERVLRVKQYLQGKGLDESRVPGQEMTALGESASKSKNPNDERDRAVRIVVAIGRKWKPIPSVIVFPEIVIGPTPRIDPVPLPAPPFRPPFRPPARPPARPKFSREFEIKQWEEDGAGLGPKLISGAIQHWQIRDTVNREEIYCTATGVGLGLGLPISVTGEGPWNPIQPPVPLELNDFAGFYRWNSYYAAGPYSSNYMTFYNLGSIDGYWEFDVSTGTTVGAGGPTMLEMYMVCSNPKPY